MGVRTTSEPQYQVILQDHKFEIRQYPALLIAETVVRGNYQEAGNAAFNRLAGYIFGANQRRENLAMTTPVIREQTGEAIAMTAPVLQQTEGKQWRMAFVMPAGYRLDTLPIPLDDSILLTEIPAKKVATIRYNGSLNEERIAIHSQKLLTWLAQQSLKPLSAFRSAAYDPPWTLPIMRRNEIHVDIQ